MSESASLESPPPQVRIPDVLPLLPVRDVVIYPGMVLPLAVGRERSIRAMETAMAGDHLVFVATQKKLQADDPQETDLYPVGIVCETLQMVKMPDGTAKILVEGVQRAR